MKPPCEIVVRIILPRIRSMIVNQLFNKYGLTQQEIARRLGLTQPAVSYYLSEKRGLKGENLLKKREVREAVEKIAKGIAENTMNKLDTLVEMCRLCKTLRASKKFICEIYKQTGGFPEICDVCDEITK
ncbi:MAG: winged helix-turn-helix transcriptional regulator [Candidatus Odinarchaeota archaeon]|nr:winged helix-turn-helix transcriptional regulator [Candidatus Odinarchaeota archaeon]